MQRREEINAHVDPFAVVVSEVNLHGFPVGYEVLRDAIKRFLLDAAVEPLDMRVVVRLPDPRMTP